jgi:GT2 family glycosyltransferase
MSGRDVEDCYTLFLGRSPEGEAAARCADAELEVVLGTLLQDPEFQDGVLTPLLLRESLPHERLAASPPLRLIDWAQRRLPLEPQSRTRAGAARSWVDLLELLLSDRTLAALADNLRAAGVDQLLRERLDRSPLAAATRAVVGAVDSASTLEIRGWAVDLCDKSIPVRVEIYADNLFVGAATCVESRPDVREAVGGEGRCGFTFQLPSARRADFDGGRFLTVIDAVSRVRIGVSTLVHADFTQGLDILGTTRSELKQVRALLARIEARLPDLSRLVSVPLAAYGEYWQRFYRLAPDVLAVQRVDSEDFAFAPLISVVLPTWNSDATLLGKAIESVLAQSYERWELILTDDASAPSDALRQLLAWHGRDRRVRYLGHRERAGIAGNTNRGIGAAGGDYVAFLDHDDELAADALFEVVRTLQESRYALVYSDEDRIEEDSLGCVTHHSPFFKPGFDADLLRSLNYICHLVVLRRDVLTASGGLRAGIDGAQDHDLLLRVTERLDPAEIRHVPRILYHWRVTPGSVSRTPALNARIQESVVAVVQDHLNRCGLGAEARAHADPFGASRSFATRVRWPLPDRAPPVSIIIPTRDRMDLLRPCIESLQRSASRYPGPVEILIVDNDSVEAVTQSYLDDLSATGVARVLPIPGEFNWSALNNAAVPEARGDVVIFLNNDTVALSEDWCAELIANALRPEVGAVGARLLYDDGTLQHAGVVLGVEGVAGHESVGEAPERGGYFGRSHLQRSAAAVTGACLATRRALFLEIGGFDAMHLKVAFNDVDYCLRLRNAGYRVVINPFAVLYHFESKSRGLDLSESKVERQREEAAVFRARWADIVDRDPYYNAHFERYARPFARLRPPP